MHVYRGIGDMGSSIAGSVPIAENPLARIQPGSHHFDTHIGTNKVISTWEMTTGPLLHLLT